jgi:hypothetical protein
MAATLLRIAAKLNREASRLEDVGSKNPFANPKTGSGRSDIAAQHRQVIWLFRAALSRARNIYCIAKKS